MLLQEIPGFFKSKSKLDFIYRIKKKINAKYSTVDKLLMDCEFNTK